MGAAPRTGVITARAVVPMVCAIVAAVLVAVPAPADISDTLAIIKEGEQPSNVELAIRLAQNTPVEGIEQVVIGRDDEFVDSLASATMQDESLLLLVPPGGPVPDSVFTMLDQLAPQRVVLLGGTAAISSGVEETFVDRGFEVARRAGATRFETAIDIARQEAPAATTAILARAFPAEDAGDPTQAFADALAAGAWAADRSWVVLLTQTEVLTPSTRAYLAESSIDRVEIMGGTAAISADVERELVDMGMTVARTAGPNRFATAVEVAAKRGAGDASDAGRIVLVDGQDADAWAGGFAAAAHSATFDAPVVLAEGDGLPPATQEWLDGAAHAFAQAGTGIRLTCVTLPAACDRAREALDLPSEVEVEFDPPDGSTVRRESTVRLRVTADPDGQLTGAVEVSGPCVLEGGYALEQGTVPVRISPAAPLGPCTVSWGLAFESGLVQTESATYTVDRATAPPPPPPSPTPTSTASPAPPTASFSWQQANNCNETVSFTDTSSGSVTGWSWDFGDGGSSSAQNPSHTYSGSGGFGSFGVELTVTGPGGSDTTRRTVTLECIID